MAFDHFLGSKYITEDATSDMEDKVEAEVSMNEEDDQNDSESSEITGVTNDYMKLIKTISDLIIKQKTADFPDKMKLHKQINAYGNQKVALEDKLIDTLAGLNQNAGLEGNNETIKSLLTQRSYNNEGKEEVAMNEAEIGGEELIEKIKNLDDFGFTGDKIEFKGLLITASTQEDNEKTPHYFVYGEDDESEDGIFSSTNPEEVAEFVLNY
jgi:hypothetical protein